MERDVTECVRAFVDLLNRRPETRTILAERDHFLDFEVAGGSRFHIAVVKGSASLAAGPAPAREDGLSWITHFSASAETLSRLFTGEVGFSECFVPMRPDVSPLLVRELDMMMTSGTINWFGRMVRLAQEARVRPGRSGAR